MGWGPIHFAVFLGYSEIVQFLIDKGADVNKVTIDGWTPL